MINTKKLVSIILILCMAAGMLPGLSESASAQTNPVLYVDRYDAAAKVLSIKWYQPETHDLTKSVRVTYHIPGQSGVETVVLNAVDPSQPAANPGAVFTKQASRVTVDITDTRFKSDIVYDIFVEIFDNTDFSGAPIAVGLIYFMPQISFLSEIQQQLGEPVGSNGKEIGDKPVLRLKWAKSRVWNGTDFTNLHNSLDAIADRIESVYGTRPDIASLDYKIGISSSAAIEVRNVNGINETEVSGIGFERQLDESEAGYWGIYLMGRKDGTVALPKTDAELTEYISSNFGGLEAKYLAVKDYLLPHPDLYPGTVYNMSIKPVFKSSGSPAQDLYIITVGDPSAQNDSIAYSDVNSDVGKARVPYAYTPVRFKLSKDSMDNIFVDIYRITKGSLNLPKLYYQVQVSNDSSIPGDWKPKAKITDAEFSGPMATTVIPGNDQDINPSNLMYYKVVVKSDDSSDRLESWHMDYILRDDLAKPLAPRNISISTGPASTPVPSWLLPEPYRDDPALSEKTCDITVSWLKPDNFVKDDNTKFYFELNVYPFKADIHPVPTLVANGIPYGNFPLKYRLSNYIGGSCVTDLGEYLSYTINGLDLFKYEDSTTGGLADFDSALMPEEDYPRFLLPNTVYYLRMYTMAGDTRSDYSVVASFTTPADPSRNVPIPRTFTGKADFLVESVNGKDRANHYITLDFEKIRMDESFEGTINYELEISKDGENFIPLGDTENPGDVDFSGTDISSTNITARIESYPGGEKLRPNFTYYFRLRTRVKFKNLADDRYSIYTAVLPVTTLQGIPGEPDEDGRRPMAPVDFAIAVDSSGNPLLTGSAAAFSWTRYEADTTFQIVASSSRLAPQDLLPVQDQVYQSFIAAFGGLITADPANPVPGDMEYDPSSQKCLYTISKWLYPNRLYYFSIRSVKTYTRRTATGTVSETRYSPWVSIPVTTSLIDAPTELKAVNDCQIGFRWSDPAAPFAIADDYRIYVQGPDDKEFKYITRSQCTIVKDGQTFYGRLRGLEPDSTYRIRVYRGVGSTLVYENLNARTRDTHHQIEVQWKGQPGYTYEIALMTEGESDYRILSSHDFDLYQEENVQTSGKIDAIFHALIKTAEIVLPGGSLERQPLQSNTKYYIKVRAVRIDSLDVSRSKYAGPVETRTDFDQGDYDNEDKETGDIADYLDKIDMLESALFWRINIGDRTRNQIMLKGERVSNALENSGRYGFLLDISALMPGADTDIVYIPVQVLRTLRDTGRNLTIRTVRAEFTLRPNTLNPESQKEIKDMISRSGVKDTYIRLTITRTGKASIAIETGKGTANEVHKLETQVLGSSREHSELRKDFNDKLYNEETGLVNAKKNQLMDVYRRNISASIGDMSAFINRLVSEVESELSVYVSTVVNSTIGINGWKQNVGTFGASLIVKLVYTSAGMPAFPCILEDGSKKWSKAVSGVLYNENSITFNAASSGKYAIVLMTSALDNIPLNHWASEDIARFVSRYDLSGVFAGLDTSFNPDLTVSVGEITLLYEMIMNKEADNAGLSTKQKLKAMQLDTIYGNAAVTRDSSRQEAAAVLIKIFCSKNGLDAASVRPGRLVYIKDEDQISSKFINDVTLVIDLELMMLDSGGKFRPGAGITRAEIISSMVRILEKTGELL